MNHETKSSMFSEALHAWVHSLEQDWSIPSVISCCVFLRGLFSWALFGCCVYVSTSHCAGLLAHLKWQTETRFILLWPDMCTVMSCNTTNALIIFQLLAVDAVILLLSFQEVPVLLWRIHGETHAFIFHDVSPIWIGSVFMGEKIHSKGGGITLMQSFFSLFFHLWWCCDENLVLFSRMQCVLQLWVTGRSINRNTSAFLYYSHQQADVSSGG